MNSNIADSAKSVCQHVDALLATRVSEVSTAQLKESIDGLRSALADIQAFVDSVEGVAEYVASGGKILPRSSSRPRTKGRRGRSPDDFPVTDFILESLRNNPKGMRPVELKDRMVARAPSRHTQPAATISTTLTRLKKKGAVVNKGGLWKLAKPAK